MPIKIRKPFSKSEDKSTIKEYSDGRTKASFKDECNINLIVKKYQSTRHIPGVRENGQYSDITAMELHDAMVQVAEAKTMFEELPSNIRDQFENDPVKFLDFTQDPENVDDMIELGLAKRIPEAQPQRVEVVNQEPPSIEENPPSP